MSQRASALAALLATLLAVLLPALPALAQPTTTADRPLSERRVSYVIDVTLDPATRSIHGHERITWRNPDRVPVDELQFHLYLNAFRDRRSTFMRESGGQHRGNTATGGDAWGGIEITRMTLGEADLTGAMTFIQPDDGNPDDRTVLSVRLPRAVAPGETIALDVDFEATFPRIFARTGWAERHDGTRFFMGAQWFPKLGVYEVPGQRYVPRDATRGQWNTHQFHANSEFYADFGTYEVTLTTPAAYVVGATGVRVAEHEEGDRRTVTYRADDVHDFAWTASDAFLTFEDTWRHVQLRLLLLPEHRAQARRHFDAAKVALERFDDWVGEYPYTTLTLVDGVGGSNGMEYPTLITCGTYYLLPGWLRALELVTIHEFGHQYFYGLLGSNEFEEAWLDEGINSYLEARIVDAHYGAGAVLDFPGLRIGDMDYQRVAYAKSHPERGALYMRSWDYDYYSDYARNAYSKPAVVLATMEHHLGWDVMRRILRTYYERWRFRHPTTRDFIAVAEEVAGRDLSWFFDQFVYGNATIDYAVERLVNHTSAGDSVQAAPRSTVVVSRLGTGYFPQTLRLRFDDGTTQDVAWDGRDDRKRFTFDRPIAEAYLDPENVVLLDLDRLNNRRLARADDTLARKVQLKFTVWLQQVFYLAAALF